MGNIIDKKIFELAVQNNENFEMVFDIHSRYEEIKGQLVDDFFEDLKQFLTENSAYFVTSENEWEIDIEIKNLKKFFYYIDWTENNFKYGLYLNKENYKVRTQIIPIKNELVELLSTETIQESDNVDFYKEINFDLDSKTSLIKLLPHNRELLIKEINMELQKFIEKTVDKLKDLEKEYGL